MPEALGNWHDKTTLRAAWDQLPAADTNPGEIGADIVAASKAECVRHLESEGLPVPEDGAVPASHRMAQLFYARALWATRVTSASAESTGLPGYEVPATAFRKQARDQLGYGSLGIA